MFLILISLTGGGKKKNILKANSQFRSITFYILQNFFFWFKKRKKEKKNPQSSKSDLPKKKVHDLHACRKARGIRISPSPLFPPPTTKYVLFKSTPSKIPKISQSSGRNPINAHGPAKHDSISHLV